MTDKKDPFPSSSDSIQNPIRTPEDEVNLIELLEVLLSRKALIILVTLFFSIPSVLYSLWATPIYRAAMGVLPAGDPAAKAIWDTIGADVDTEVFSQSKLTITNQSVFEEFLTKMQSYTHYQKVLEGGNFFEKFNGSTDEFKNSGQLLSSIHGSLILRRRYRDGPFTYISIEGSNPKLLAEFLNASAEAAIRDIQIKTKKRLAIEEKQITREREYKFVQAQNIKKYLITFLNEELKMARKMNIKSNNFKFETGSHIQPIWFLYGEAALIEEIKTLEESKFYNDISFSQAIMLSNKFNSVMQKHYFGDLGTIAVSTDTKDKILATDLSAKLRVVDIEPSISPINPIKPKKSKIIFICTLLGLFLGITAAFLGSALENFRKRKKRI